MIRRSKHVVTNEDIARYYDTEQVFYTLFWSRTALHYGLWYEDTKSLREAVLNTNKFVIDALDIRAADKVLDAGCGVGGTGIYIAESTGATVEGITLSSRQLRIARRRASKSLAAGALNFSKSDFVRTGFKDQTFSKVFGIESVCYAQRKSDFLREAHRIMKPGGMIAVIDLFLVKAEFDANEMSIYSKTIEGWAIPNLATVSQFLNSLLRVGFRDIRFHNLHRQIENSSRRMYFQKLVWSPVDIVFSYLGREPENLSAKYQKAFFDSGIGTYCAFVATKV